MTSRRDFIKKLMRLTATAGFATTGLYLSGRPGAAAKVSQCASGCDICTVNSMQTCRVSNHTWQLDPAKCIQCGNCATSCVLNPSAVKCMHLYEKCGYCDLCSGYFIQGATRLNTGAENQLCPTGALERKFIEEPYFEYKVIDRLCVGCGRCVETCSAFGNASLILQVRHDLCLNCNECAIAVACPAQAFYKVQAKNPYLFTNFRESCKS